MVFYRKYRPQTISELDSPKLQETLKAVLSQKEVPHAFLFTGPKGLGKTSTARIIAKVLNCTGANRKGIEPCNECEQCISITNGTNIDVLEIDGASNRGIDEIRELRERVNLAPSASQKKVYIIDEVHMLTTEAFNALLKTIEEPPAHVVFIFATTEPQKVPATIISRCFHISLNRATKDELIHALKRIVEKEKQEGSPITIDDEALGLIAAMGDGGYRDATKIFEEIVAVAQGAKIDKKFIENHYKIAGVSLEVADFLQHLKEHNAPGSLAVIQKIGEQGTSMKFFIEQVLLRLHTLILMHAGIQKTDAALPDLRLEEISLLTTLFSEAYQQTKYAVIPSLPVELAVVEYCQQGAILGSEATPESDPSTPSENEGSWTSQDDGSKSSFTLKDARKQEQNLKVKQVLSGTKNPSTSLRKQDTEHTQENLPKDVKDHAVLLENLIYKVKPYNHSVAGVLRSCVVQSVSDSQVVFQTAYAFHKERLEDMKSREILEKGLREITGKNLTVSIVLKGK